ncbi:MAG TPA: hypothetical protein VFX48_07800 [Saprospiraceae bacterium]|nr:hypothetical protein [Saprospiraceae bacterium]
MIFYRIYRPGTAVLTALVFLSLLISSCRDKSREVEEHYSFGPLSRKTTMVGKHKEGPMTDYYPDGKVKAIREFKANLQHGRSVFYYPDGSLQKVQYYQDNLQEDTDSSFYENGKVKLTMDFTKGIKNGYIRKFDSTGNLYFSARYAMDSLVEVNGVILAK